MTTEGLFSFFIDRGGTFTDVIALLPSGAYRTLKLLSVDPKNYADAPTEGIRRVLEAELQQPFPRNKRIDTRRIKAIRMGTTVATNALLERKGERVCMITTKGFKDLWKIGNQSRPKIFELDIEKTKPGVLYEAVVEVEERVTLPGAVLANGREVRVDPTKISVSSTEKVRVASTGEPVFIEKAPDLAILKEQLEAVHRKGIRSVAVCLMHGAIFPDHEQLVGDLCRDIGFPQVSLSHEVMNMVKIVPRGYTTAADAYLTPHIVTYIDKFVAGFDHNLLQRVEVSFMQSDGGLAEVTNFSGHKAVLSGPAGGVVGYAFTSYVEPVSWSVPRNNETLGLKPVKPVIGFDMGGTSTDVSRFAGKYEHVFETATAGVMIQAPQLDISTVAAGGGSKLTFFNGMFSVGPDSVGAEPGPICYRKTQFSADKTARDYDTLAPGELAVTDANLFLGRLHQNYFPTIFGPRENEPLDLAATSRAFVELTEQVNAHQRENRGAMKSPEQVAFGYLQVANEAMCRPIREITQMKGFDLKKHTLASFGGAGGQHACAVARRLGIETIHVHRYSGLLSALGIGLADLVVEKQEPCSFILARFHHESHSLALCDDVVGKLRGRLERLAKLAREQLHAGSRKDSRYQFTTTQFLNMRYDGTDCHLMIEVQGAKFTDAILESFRTTHQRQFGFLLSERDIIVDDVRVRCSLQEVTMKISRSSSFIEGSENLVLTAEDAIDSHPVYFEERWIQTSFYSLPSIVQRLEGSASCHVKAVIQGPAVLIDKTATILLEPFSIGEVSADGDVFIQLLSPERQEPNIPQTGQGSRAATAVADPIELAIFSHRFMSIAERKSTLV